MNKSFFKIAAGGLIIILGVITGLYFFKEPGKLERLREKISPQEELSEEALLPYPTINPTPHNTPTPGKPRLDNPTEDYVEELKRSQIPENHVVVKITNRGFDPSVAYLKKGGVVSWVNQDDRDHQVSGDSGFWGTKRLIEPGGQFSQQFDVSGEYPYHCALNKDLKGKVIVE